MCKQFLFALCFSALALTTTAQNVKKEAETVKTKMEAFVSKTGTITRFVDYNLPGLKTTYDRAETRIRKVSNTSGSALFFQIEKKKQYGSAQASIEYTDLLELIKALKLLRAEVDKDLAATPDYLENKFVTVDGFQLGYYVSGKKVTWYIKLEKYGSDNTLFLSDPETIDAAFAEAKTKMDGLK